MSAVGSLQKANDGTPLVVRGIGASSTLGQLAGVMKALSRAEFDKLVTDERGRIAANSAGIYPNGETIGRVTGELGERSWTFVTGGSDAANAAASHARNVTYLGKTYALAADANVFGSTTGAPGGGTGANGDILVDAVAGLLYGPKASGSWPAGVSIMGAAAHVVSGAYDGGGSLILTMSDGTTLPPIVKASAVPIVGFYLNGAASLKLKAAVTRVKLGTGRARMVMKGDSTTVGQGAGSTLDANGLTSARNNRIAKVLAGLLTSSGTRALDGSIVGDNGMWVASGFPLPSYDSRVSYMGAAAAGTQDQSFAGASLLSASSLSAAAIGLTPDAAVDTVEIVYYNSAPSTVALTIDGSAPASGPASYTAASSSGFSKAIVKASSIGTHALLSSFNTPAVAIRSITAYDSTTAAIDILVHAALGATSTQQAASNGSWYNQEALAFDAPDLTTINLGLNDMNTGVSVSTYAANLQAIITKAQISGDVLLIFPTPAAGNYNTNVAAMNAAAKSLAASAGIPFLSLYEHYGAWNSAFGARQFDGAVHPNAGLYAEIAGLMKSAIDAMIAA